MTTDAKGEMPMTTEEIETTVLTLRARLTTIAIAVKASRLPCHTVAILYRDAEDVMAAHAEGWYSPLFTQDRTDYRGTVVTEVFHARILDVPFTLFYDRPPTSEEMAAQAAGRTIWEMARHRRAVVAPRLSLGETMTIKTIEIRDAGTFIAALAIKISSADGYLARRAGYGEFGCVLFGRMAGREWNYDPYEWGDRTMATAHHWITEHFDEIDSGAVVDVAFLLGETRAPKASEECS